MPSVRASEGRATRRRACRKGSSTSEWEIAVGTHEAATTARPASGESGPQSAAAKISAGQCQRYQA